MQRRHFLRLGTLAAASPLLPATSAAALPLDSGVQPAAPGDMLLLGSNENPYGPPRSAIKAMQKALEQGNRYADPEILRQKIATKCQVPAENILLGAGSTEILQWIAIAYLNSPSKGLVWGKPGFPVLPMIAERLGAVSVPIPLSGSKHLDLEAMGAAINAQNNVVYLCNPNNPTGARLPFETLKNWISQLPENILVVADEVYQEFNDAPSLCSLLPTQKNLIVVRSFSKIYGLAGMRIGYGIAHTDVIERLSACIAWPGNSNSQASLAAAAAALDDRDFVAMTLEKNEASKQLLYSWLQSVSVEYYPSFSNCSYFSLDRFPADFLQQMKQRRIIVREIDDWGRRYCRVSTGKPEEMQQFIQALKSLIHSK
jgi:histidinol-phosphate aminotransferase